MFRIRLGVVCRKVRITSGCETHQRPCKVDTLDVNDLINSLSLIYILFLLVDTPR